MKHIFFSLLMMTVIQLYVQAQTAWIDKKFNSDRKFSRIDLPQPAATDFDDSAWRKIDVHHDLGYTDLSCMGSKYHETPNIDQVAKEGMMFLNGYAACSVCNPSRASIMTGKFPARHGITNWIGEASGEEWRKTNRSTKLLPAAYVHELNKDFIILPEALKENGYKTFFAGKWHLGDVGSYPEDQGFDINKGGYESGSPKGD